MDAQRSGVFYPDPSDLASVPVYELLDAAARGHAGIDRRFIRAIVDRGEQAAPDLLRFGLEPREGDLVDLEEDLIAIFRHLRTPSALPFFIECIRRQPEDIPDDVVNGILQFSADAVGPLLELHDALDEDQSSDIAFLLATSRIRDERILKALLERLEYDAADGAFCLGVYGDPAAKPSLERLLGEIPDKDGDLRREIRFAIEQIDEERPDPAEPEPFDIWDAYAEQAPPPVEALTEEERLDMLESASAELRAEAAESFRLGETKPSVRAILIQKAKSDPDPNVRGRCWEALADATDEREIRDAMKAVASDENAPLIERAGAVVGLAEVSDDPEVARRMRELYANPASRAKALEAMWRSFDRQFAEYFPPHLDDVDGAVKRQAIWGVGYMGIGSQAARLRALFDDEEFRGDALYGYALSVPSEISRGRVRPLLKKIDGAAGGLSADEAELVQVALDDRLVMHGYEPVFVHEHHHDEDEDEDEEVEAAAPAEPAVMAKVGRNDPCPCGSGKKYKKCHGT